MDGRIYFLIEHLRSDLTKPWTVGQMAALAELSVPRFQQLFKTETGQSPMSFLKDLRLERARRYLEEGFSQVKQIGNLTGLRNESHFSRDFKIKFGVTPTQYRLRIWLSQQHGTSLNRKQSFLDRIDSFSQEIIVEPKANQS